jgi:hypothetical protein
VALVHDPFVRFRDHELSSWTGLKGEEMTAQTMTPEAFHVQIAKERKIVKNAARSLVKALRLGDHDLFSWSVDRLRHNSWDGWSQVYAPRQN